MSIEKMMVEFFEAVESKVENFESFRRNVETEIEDAIVNAKLEHSNLLILLNDNVPNEEVEQIHCDNILESRKQIAVWRVFEKYYIKFGFISPEDSIKSKLKYCTSNDWRALNLKVLQSKIPELIDTPVAIVDGKSYEVSTEIVKINVSELMNWKVFDKNADVKWILENLNKYKLLYTVEFRSNSIPHTFERAIELKIQGVKV